jgi:hypothetical protein
MAPVEFNPSCRGCHSLQFDRHIQAEAPHASPQVVHDFVVEQLTQFAARNPEIVRSEIAVWPESLVIPGRPPLVAPRNADQWIAAETKRSLDILWGQKCNLCHEVSSLSPDETLPQITPTHQRLQWFQQAVFQHYAHQEVTCESCHARSVSSTNGFDVLLPGIATCQRCHNGAPEALAKNASSGHAQSGCYECHQYHNWTTDRNATPRHTFSIEQLSRLSISEAAPQNLSALHLPEAPEVHP